MDNTDYQRILFDTAMLVMVCDGEVNESEIKEMELAFDKDILFTELDFHEEVTRMKEKLTQDIKQYVISYFSTVENNLFSPVQKLKILEIALRIMYADNRIEPNEIRFIKLLKSRLGIIDEIFFKRFGEVNFLSNSGSTEKIIDTARTFAGEVELPDFGDIIERRGNSES